MQDRVWKKNSKKWWKLQGIGVNDFKTSQLSVCINNLSTHCCCRSEKQATPQASIPLFASGAYCALRKFAPTPMNVYFDTTLSYIRHMTSATARTKFYCGIRHLRVGKVSVKERESERYSTWSKEFQNSREAISVELLHRMWWNLIWQCIFRCFTPFKVFDVIRWTFFTTPKRDIFQPIWSHHWILRKISLNLKKKSTFYDQRFRSYGQLNFSSKF